MSDNSGPFDPHSLRHFSILSEEEDDEAWCVRHDRRMVSRTPIVHTQGALYSTTEKFTVYSCPACLSELNQIAAQKDIDNGGAALFKRALHDAFEQWDEGESPGEWFRYIGEGSVEDLPNGQGFVAFDEGPGGDSR